MSVVLATHTGSREGPSAAGVAQAPLGLASGGGTLTPGPLLAAGSVMIR